MSNFLIDPLLNMDSYKNLIKDINDDISPIFTYGLIDDDLGHFVYGLNEHLDKQILLVTYDESKSRRLYEDIRNLGNENVELFPKKEKLFYDIDASSYENINQRLRVISKLLNGEKIIVIASLESLLDKIVTKEVYEEYTQKIDFEVDINLDDLVNKLVIAGYERVHMVEGVGQFSIRGGIIDVFSPNNPNPYRVELFDEEVDSIRTFDVITQRSLDIMDNIVIPPVKEVLILEEYRETIYNSLKRELEGHKYQDKTLEKYGRYLELIQEKAYISNIHMVLPFIPDDYLGTLLNYLSNDSLVFMDEPKRIEERANIIKDEIYLKTTDLLEAGEILSSHVGVDYSYKELLPEILDKTVVVSSTLLRASENIQGKSIHNFSVKSMTNYHNKMDLLVEDINYYKYRGYKIIILSGTEERGIRLKENLLEFGIDSTFSMHRTEEIKSGQLFITTGSVQSGFEYSSIKLVIISDREIFGAQKKKSKISKKKSGQKLINISDLVVGSYVVHETHGIGQYEGIEQLDIQGIKKDYLTIRYKGQDKLYIPIDQMNMIQKYIGADGVKPKVNKLNSGDWQKTKTKAKKAVEEMAQDLLDLYAKRETLKGYAFSKDTPWQRQFEDLFPYEETEGQLSSIVEIKKDMEKPKPMDRLLCGDVGYGKTEVALRAAFKALMDGKQVAILVPTTILAQQHYNTIVERFRDFPIKPALLSRFRSPKEIKLSIEGIKNGVVDIVVGTHRLLSKDVKFKDIGLLIIDEEQRFGVKHKEALKQLKENIDVLTLTATPIPRTLQMSMVGIRDMSVLEEPPEERYPIQTYVVEFNEQMIRDAILKEISRGGQVYFVYNRVDTIDKITSKLRVLVPEATFAIGHGQMAEKQLEKVMMDFLDKEQDVLVCTTIIETGLDIPNVNTIIIFDSDKMGLSQLYQLRGRVGRSNRIAYGYFTYEKNKVLSEIAERRLRAIKEFTEFGSGFKIAMRDLEIRGAGNLLGMQQHGHIEAIGYDLYVKFLSEAISRLKGGTVKENIDTTIDLNVSGFIPKRYIEDEEQKIEVYKKIAAIESNLDYSELIDELIDRFGDIPLEVRNLMLISYVKAIASKNNIKNIIQSNNIVKLELVSSDSLSLELIKYISDEYGKSLVFNLSNEPCIEYRSKGEILENLKTLIEKIDSFHREDVLID
ncbi:MAG: transcription-repair coupling factor [Tissierellaceae bacterium]|nr:transcription-repair coupling factor [Tissierellaceae bacterium]